MILARKNIQKITPYQAGKPIEETRREWGLASIIKLASNENPLGVSPKALKAIIKHASGVNRYPDSSGFYLKNTLAKKLGVASANIVLGNGSDELIDTIIKTFAEEDENIITADITFLEYGIIAKTNGRKIILVPLKNFRYDLEAIKRKINSKTKLIFIANPNNPTGTYVNNEEVKNFIQGLPKKVILVLDEAYDTFIDVKDFPDSYGYLGNKNIIILKTFSKAYGLAGLRVGYALARLSLAAFMEKVRQPFNVNLLAQAAAMASLGDEQFLLKTRKVVLGGKKYLYRALMSLGVAYIPSVANFILLDLKRDGREVFKKMLRYGVIVRDMQQYGLKNFIRVTVGTEKENKKFIQALKKVLRYKEVR